MLIRANHLRVGDAIAEGTISSVVVDDDDVVFYLEEETGGFMIPSNGEIEVDRSEAKPPLDKTWIVAPPAATLSAETRFRGGPDVGACEFWQWGFSDLRLNIVRGILAEFLVAKAVGDPADKLRDPWANYDVRTPEGITIEIKSSAYLQAWDQQRLTKPIFAGLTGRSWAPLTGKSKEREIRAQVFVFCLQTATTHENYDPLDVGQWRFWAMNASYVKDRATRSVALSFVNDNAVMCEWNELKQSVEEAAG
jgi:hypothetical protein